MDTKTWLEAELKRAKDLFTQVEAKVLEGQRGYDDVMLQAHNNRIQGLKDTLDRIAK